MQFVRAKSDQTVCFAYGRVYLIMVDSYLGRYLASMMRYDIDLFIIVYGDVRGWSKNDKEQQQQLSGT